MNTNEHYWWRIGMELKLRQTTGDAFQELYSCLMAQLYAPLSVSARRPEEMSPVVVAPPLAALVEMLPVLVRERSPSWLTRAFRLCALAKQ